MICTVTGPTVVDSQGYQSSVTDRCMYSLLSDSSSSFEVLANFQERRRRDVSFLDSVSLRPVGSNDYFHLEQGGRVKMNETVLTLNSSAQQIQNIMLSKDKTGLSAVFSFSGLKISVMFDGYTAQIHMNVPVGSSMKGLCVDSRNISSPIRCFVNRICTVTGPTVVDSQGYQSSVTDRCMYSLLSDSSSSFELLANFQERRRRDVSFLDSVSLRPVGSNDYFHLEQGGRVKMNETLLTLNSSAQQIQNIMLSKDKTGLSAVFSFSGLKISVMFDGYTAQIHMNVPVGSSMKGLCVDSRNISSVKRLDLSSSSCERQYEDPVDSQINCNMTTEYCNL
ncbi:PREDICTED: uncharacterized protein LOC107097344, partial [Cyprinodon variegatus]|uniref:uncharacterized protein LOC107097344 n=1 Tax=Cyprinodon variegatus TaxID=28743 RepID=UPI000742763E